MHEAEKQAVAEAVAPPAIELKSVYVNSGGYELLRGVSLAIPRASTSVLLGATGSGKSALLKAAAGLLVPGSGSVEYLGKDMAKFSKKDETEFRAHSGFIFQDAALWANTNILNNVSMPLRVHKPWMGQSELAEAVRMAFKRLGYEEGMALRPSDLSAGEQKMVCIARAVVHDPDLVFMDDPGTNLDEDGLEQLFALIAELEERGKTLVIASNNSEFAYRYADMLGIIKDGVVVAFGSYEDTLARAEKEPELKLTRLRARGLREKKARRGAS
ncbi:MAG TPA: ABC transporter [Spirochaetaceae bacterium]|jgi:phospholipid/cholesterol/gamma-HCH transport system ATP-binding protein|nr:ABC transporter [Spirochaetaceae bacterium]